MLKLSIQYNGLVYYDEKMRRAYIDWRGSRTTTAARKQNCAHIGE